MPTRTSLLFSCAAVMLLLAACASVSTVRLANCDVAHPPPTAGEEADLGAKLLIFPRARQMAPAYSGCQSVWIDVGNGRPMLIGRFRYEAGKYVGYSAPLNGKPEALLCSYRDGKLIAGDAGDCESDHSRPIPSLPAGCFAALHQEAATGRPAPTACHVYE